MDFRGMEGRRADGLRGAFIGAFVSCLFVSGRSGDGGLIGHRALDLGWQEKTRVGGVSRSVLTRIERCDGESG